MEFSKREGQRKCSTCHINQARAGQRNCRGCHAAYMRKNRRPYHALTDIQRKKSLCRSYTKVMVKRGKLTRKPCGQCGNEKTEAHHVDYGKPMIVHWLCRPCHQEWHRTVEHY